MNKKILNKTKENLSMGKEGEKNMDTSREEKIQKAYQELKAVNEEKKYPRIETVNEINHEYIQNILVKSSFSVVYQMLLDKEKGVKYPAKYAYPVTVEDFCAALKNCFCRYLIHELILRGYGETRGLYISPDYREYHVIAKKTENTVLCIVTNDVTYDYMCWVEIVDIEMLKTYTKWVPLPLMELAKKLCIIIGL